MTKTDNRKGYSAALVAAVHETRHGKIRVVHGFAITCIEESIPVQKVADLFSVSRQTVYAWFTGASRPRPKHEEMMRQFLAERQAHEA